jgi:hypothetical protein
VVQGRVQARRQVRDRSRAVDVGGPLPGVVGGDVVDRRAVHDVVDAPEVGQRLVAEPEIRCGQVADQRFRAVAPLLGEPLEAPERLASHQHPHLWGVAAGTR